MTKLCSIACCVTVLMSLGCASSSGGSSGSSKDPGEHADALEREVVSLRRERDTLLRKLEMQRDRQLMCADASLTPEPAPAPTQTAKLRPESSHRQKDKRYVAGAVSLSDVPYSAPDAALMDRYEGSAASDIDATASQPPRRYEMIGSPSASSSSKPAKRGARRDTDKPAPAPPVAEDTAQDKALYERGRTLYTQGERSQARAMFARLEAEYPSSDLADNAAYWQADDDFEAGRLKDAMSGFMRILSNYPRGNKVEDAMYKLGLCYAQRDDEERARAMLLQVVKGGRKELRIKAKRALSRLKSSAR